MRRLTATLLVVLAVHPIVAASDGDIIQLSPSVRLLSGPVNGVQIERNGHTLVVYGDPSGTIGHADIVLFMADVLSSILKLTSPEFA